MKRILCICFAVILAMTGAFAFADRETAEGSFKPLLLSELDMSAVEWTDSEMYRCMFTLLATLEYALEQRDVPDMDYAGATFCGRDSSIVSTCVKCTEGDDSYWLIVSYSSILGECFYITIPATSTFDDKAIEEVLRGNNTDGLYRNDLITMMAAMQALGEILES